MIKYYKEKKTTFIGKLVTILLFIFTLSIIFII